MEIYFVKNLKKIIIIALVHRPDQEINRRLAGGKYFIQNFKIF